jgi:hypothetical protein
MGDTYQGTAVFGDFLPQVTATWNSGTTNNTVLSLAVQGYGVVQAAAVITPTLSAGSLSFEVSDDLGTTWWPIYGVQTGTFTANNTYSLNGTPSATWDFSVGAYTNFRIRLNPVITGAGSVVVRMQAESLPRDVTMVVGQGTAPWTVSSISEGVTGSAVPASADYLGIKVGSNLVGVTGFTVGSSTGAAVAIIDGSGNQITSFGGGTQFAMNSAQGSSAIGTLSLGYDGADVRGILVDATGQLRVTIQNVPHTIVDSGSVVVTNAGTFAVQATLAAETTKVIGTVNQGTSPWVVAATLSAETAKVIGTVNVASAQTIAVTQATAANLNATVTPPTLTKNTQGATGFSVQELKNAGRTYVTLYAQLITGVTTEALATFTKNVNGTATTAQTTYTITSGKTFRIQSLFVRVLNTTTVANNIMVNIRVAASVAASSPIVFSCGASAPTAVSGAVGVFAADIPDGMEIAGNGSIQIGLGHVENVTTASIASMTMTGYEY